jgi:ribonuclease HI
MVLKQKKALGLGCTAMKQGKSSFSLGKYTTVSQAEVYAIKACAAGNIDKNYKNRNIYILSDSQAAIKALDKDQITSKLVSECHQSLIQLARHNRVQLIWVPGHDSITGNKTADHLSRTGSEHPFTGPESACGISFEVAKRVMNKKHIKQWESIMGLKEAKEVILGPSAKRSKDLLKLNRNQLRWIVGLFTGHCHLKGHLFKPRLTDDPICKMCLEEDESATHVLCDCEAIAHLWFHYLGQFLTEPGDYYDAPISKVLQFVQSVGLIKG